MTFDDHGQLREGTTWRNHTVATLEGPIDSIIASATGAVSDCHGGDLDQSTLEERFDPGGDAEDPGWELI